MSRQIEPQVAHERARVAALTRSRADDDPEMIGARRDLAAANLAAYVAKVVAEAPPLTDDQRTRIAAILTGGGAR